MWAFDEAASSPHWTAASDALRFRRLHVSPPNIRNLDKNLTKKDVDIRIFEP
jgi:hypothetical protein